MPTGKNLLAFVPHRLAQEVERSEGKVRVSFPRFRSKFGRAFGKLFRASELIYLTLDERSTAVWDLCDGRRNVKQISEELRARFGEDVEPVYLRLAELLSILEQNRLIDYHESPKQPA